MRTLKPSLFLNEDLAKLGPLAALLFEGLWCHADREGRLEDRPLRLKPQILPYYEADVDALLDALARPNDAGEPFILRYEAAGRRYIQIVNFVRHQNPHVKEPPSTIPPPDGFGPAPGGPVPDPDDPEPAPGEHGASTVQEQGLPGESRVSHGPLGVGSGPSAMTPEPQGPTPRGRAAAAVRAVGADVLPVDGSGGSPQHAILMAAKIAFGHAGSSEPEKRKWRIAAHDAVRADTPLTPEELPLLLAEYRRRKWPNPSLPAIVANLESLRTPGDVGGRPKHESGSEQARRLLGAAS